MLSIIVMLGLLRENKALKNVGTVNWFWALVNTLDLLLKHREIEHAFQASQESLLLSSIVS